MWGSPIFTNGGGFNPSSLSLSGWWRANYSASPWTPTASAGASGTNGNLTEATNPPTAGAAQNGFTPAAFNGTNQLLTAANTPGTYWALGTGTLIVLFYAVSAAAPAAGPYDDPGLFVTGAGGEVIMAYTTNGLECAIYNAGYVSAPNVAAATGAYHLGQMKWNGSTLRSRVDNGAWGSVNVAGVDSWTGLTAPHAGCNYAAAAFFNGRILEIMTSTTTLTDANCDSVRSYVNARYALSL